MVYIGQTKFTAEKRWNEHISEASETRMRDTSPLLNKDIRKHGEDSFALEVLIECEDYEMDFWEMHYIKEYDSMAPNGYNLTSGGSNGTRSEIAIEKRAKSRKKLTDSENLSMFIIKHNDRYTKEHTGYRVCNHKMQNGTDKRFSDKNQPMEKKLALAKEYVEWLNTLTEPIIKKTDSDLPKHVQKFKHGYVVEFLIDCGPGVRPIKIDKYFVSKSKSNEILRQDAIEYSKTLPKDSPIAKEKIITLANSIKNISDPKYLENLCKLKKYLDSDPLSELINSSQENLPQNAFNILKQLQTEIHQMDKIYRQLIENHKSL